MAGCVARLEQVKAWPPYDEFVVVEDSWKALRPVVQQQMEVGWWVGRA